LKINIWLFLSSYVTTCTSLDTLPPNQSIQEGETLVSSVQEIQQIYIWYMVQKCDPCNTHVGGNRKTPLQKNSEGFLKINSNGVLMLLNGTTNTSVCKTFFVAEF